MSATQQASGDYLIQSPIISSSSSELPINPILTNFTIRCRPNIHSYTTRPRNRNLIRINNSEDFPINMINLNQENNIRRRIVDSDETNDVDRTDSNEILDLDNSDLTVDKQQMEVSTKVAIAAVILIFVFAISSLYIVYLTFPRVSPAEKEHIKIPWNLNDAKELGIVLDKYKGEHYYHVMAGVFFIYIFLQSFAIPGSLFLSILSGYLFPFYLALVLVCTCSMLGATLCFLLSQLLGRRLVLKHLPEQASKWKKEIEKNRNNLFNYMVFLRITPLLPNWFINLTAPIVGVPLLPFALGTFVGVAPPSFFAIKGGQTLHEVQSNAFSLTSILWLLAFGLIAIAPVFLRKRN